MVLWCVMVNYSGWASRPLSGVVSDFALVTVTSSRACDLFHGCSSPDPNNVYTMTSITYNAIVTKNTILHDSMFGYLSKRHNKNKQTRAEKKCIIN